LAYSPQVYLHAAGGRTQLGKILVHPNDSATQIRLFFDQHHIAAELGRIGCGGNAADPSTDHEYFAVIAHDVSSQSVPVFPADFRFLSRTSSRILTSGSPNNENLSHLKANFISSTSSVRIFSASSPSISK
jgi:hypothetical protein